MLLEGTKINEKDAAGIFKNKFVKGYKDFALLRSKCTNDTFENKESQFGLKLQLT